jgi:hypothetical protein
MKLSSTPPLTRFLVRGGLIVVKSTLNSLLATLVLALAVVASLPH